MLNSETRAIAAHLEALATNLEQHMHAQGMTEDALACASGVSARTVGNFLRPSNRKSPRGTSRAFPSGTLANLFKIAQALEVEAWELLRTSDATARERFHLAIEAAFLERRNAER